MGQEANIGNFPDHRTSSQQIAMGSVAICWHLDGPTQLGSSHATDDAKGCSSSRSSSRSNRSR